MSEVIITPEVRQMAVNIVNCFHLLYPSDPVTGKSRLEEFETALLLAAEAVKHTIEYKRGLDAAALRASKPELKIVK